MTGKLVIGVVMAVLFGAGLWNASEMHYRSCVDAAIARTAAVPTTDPYDGVFGPSVDDVLNSNSGEARPEAIAGCSRWP